MMPADLIGFMFLGVCMLIVIGIMALVFRKRKKVTLIISSLLIISYSIYFFAFPSIQANKHEKSYAVLTEYLAQQYPDQQFTIVPEHYEVGVAPGDFDVHDVRTSNRGVSLRVNGNEVVQIATWTKPVDRQEDLWQELLLYYKETYQLDQPMDYIKELAYYNEGSFTVFGLKVDGNAAIAVYDYFDGGYRLEAIEEFAHEEVVHLVHNDQLLVLVTDKNAAATVTIALEDGERSFDVTPKQAQILVEKL